MYTITLADGTKIKDLTLNGNNFVSKTRIDEAVFKDNLDTFYATDGKNDIQMKNAFLAAQQEYEDGFYLVFAEKSNEQLLREDLDKKDEMIKWLDSQLKTFAVAITDSIGFE